MNNEEKRKIVFIMGHARSGSTILNIMLGNTPQSMAAGETGNFYRSGLLNNEYCSCGERFHDCQFWSPISQTIQEELGENVSDFISYSKALENWRNFLHPPRLQKKGLDAENYLTVNAKLYETIFEASGKHTLIDASKDPMRFHYLRQLLAYDFHIVHIVRDPRAVCWSQLRSFKKDMASGLERDMKGKSLLTTIKSLYVNAYLSEKMKASSKTPSSTINYDDMARNPLPSLTEIQDTMGLDTSSVQAIIQQQGELQQFHNAAGNRLRMSKSIKLTHDDSWKSGLNLWQRSLITALTLPLLIRYRFKILP